MQILLTTTAPELESAVDPRFGRGAYFLVVDPETLQWQAATNPAISAPGGAGVKAAQFVVDHQCKAVISGDFGPNAYQALKAAGVQMYLFGTSRTVLEVLECYKMGKLEPVGSPSPAGHRGQGRLR
jgi:predicted Fe-Mo cluster-binding NifX family protein